MFGDVDVDLEGVGAIFTCGSMEITGQPDPMSQEIGLSGSSKGISLGGTSPFQNSVGEPRQPSNHV